MCAGEGWHRSSGRARGGARGSATGAKGGEGPPGPGATGGDRGRPGARPGATGGDRAKPYIREDWNVDIPEAPAMRVVAGSRRPRRSRNPASCRYAGNRGISTVSGCSTSRKVPPARTKSGSCHADACHFYVLARSGGLAARCRPPGGAPSPPRPGETIHSGGLERRHPGSARYAGSCGISTAPEVSTSRKLPLCGQSRDLDRFGVLDIPQSPAHADQIGMTSRGRVSFLRFGPPGRAGGASTGRPLPGGPHSPPRPGETIQSGGLKRRHPASCRYAGIRRISKVPGCSTSRKVPPTRTKSGSCHADACHFYVLARLGGRAGPSTGRPAPGGPHSPPRPGETIQSGGLKRRHPGSYRYAGTCGISTARGVSTSRKLPLCGHSRDLEGAGVLDIPQSPAHADQIGMTSRGRVSFLRFGPPGRAGPRPVDRCPAGRIRPRDRAKPYSRED
jgi:hypothetical protein